MSSNMFWGKILRKLLVYSWFFFQEWSSESTLGASERIRRHRLHHHHHHYYHHQLNHQHHHAHANSASYPRTTASGLAGGPTASVGRSSLHIVPSSSSLKKQVQTSSGMRQVASADEASDSEDIDVCETCSEWLSKALLCSCQVPSSASSSPSQVRVGCESFENTVLQCCAKCV